MPMKTYCHPDDVKAVREQFDDPYVETRDWLPRGYVYYANPEPIEENVTAMIGHRFKKGDVMG